MVEGPDSRDSFSSGGAAKPTPPLPGLNVNGLGAVGLALLPDVTATLHEVSRRYKDEQNAPRIENRIHGGLKPRNALTAVILHGVHCTAQLLKNLVTTVLRQVTKSKSNQPRVSLLDSSLFSLSPKWEQSMHQVARRQLADIAMSDTCHGMCVFSVAIKPVELVVIAPGEVYSYNSDPYSGFATMLVQIPTLVSGCGSLFVGIGDSGRKYEFTENQDTTFYAMTCLTGCDVVARALRSGHRVFLRYEIRYAKESPIPVFRSRKGAPLLAVLIDADNIQAKHADRILLETAKYGNAAVRRAYGNWGCEFLSNWKEKTRELGLVERQAMVTVPGKNAADIALVIDCMDLLHSGKYDDFVVVSSDSDFTQLVSRLREDGNLVIGIGDSRALKAFRSACSKFIELGYYTPTLRLSSSHKTDIHPTNIVAQTIEPLKQNSKAQSTDFSSKAAKGCSESPVKTCAGSPSKSTAKGQNSPDAAKPIIVGVMRKLGTDGQWIALSSIGMKLQEMAPWFCAQKYGAPKLKQLVESIPCIETKMVNGHPEARVISSINQK